MKKDVNIFLGHILDSIEHILLYTQDISKKEFKNSDQLQDSIMRRMEIIGEATKHLPTNFKQKHKYIPWKKIAGMRDMLIHDYFSVDLDIVWGTLKKDLVKLHKQLELLLENEAAD